MLVNKLISPDDSTMVFYSTAEVARRLGIHHFSVCRIIRDGSLRGVKIGKSWVVLANDLDGFAKTYEARRGRRRKTETKRKEGG